MDLDELTVLETYELIHTDPRKWVDSYMKQLDDPSVDDLKWGGVINVVNGFSIKSVHEEGDTEGGGEHSEIVYAIIDSKDDDLTYFKYTGFYSSYNGTNWHDKYEIVYPRQVMITEYHPKDS